MRRRQRLHALLVRLRRALPAVIVAIVANFALTRFGVLHGIERWVADTELSLSSRVATDVAVVAITDADYDEIFEGRSPLKPQKLHDLIDAIARSGARIIAVDIDTTHPDFHDFALDSKWPPIVWEREASTAGMQAGEIEPLDILGGQEGATFRQISGMPILLDDPTDQVTRLYTRCLETKIGPLPSFVRASVAAYKGGNAQEIARSCTGAADAERPRLISFFRFQDPVRAATVLAMDAAGTSNAALTGKLVLLGGSFRDFDRHTTALGTMPGFAVLANAIETELNGGGGLEAPRWELFALEVVASAILICLFHAASVRTMVIYGIPAALVLSVAFSVLAFRSSSRLLAFAPTVLAVLAFEVYEHIRHQALLAAFFPPAHHEHGSKRGKAGRNRGEAGP